MPRSSSKRDRWPVHTVVFDVDDTLYLERDFVFSGFAAVDRWLSSERGLAGFGECARRLFAEGLRGRVFDAVLAELRQRAEPADIERLVAIYREHEPVLELQPDAASSLAWAERTFRIGLITDGVAAVQQRKIRALGLEARIACRIVTDEWGREFWKPSPEPYRRVMEQLPGSASGFVYVADNPRKDFIAPRALGWRTVRIRRECGEHVSSIATPAEEAEVEITSLHELQDLLRPESKA